jgi:hypothetical protein
MKFFVRGVVLFSMLWSAITLFCYADALDNWVWRNPQPQANDIRGVTFGNGAFVFVGGGAVMGSSTNGTAWVVGNASSTNRLYGITAGNSIFVAVGTNGTILSSSDRIAWTVQNSGNTNALMGVGFGNDIFVAAGRNGTILTSSDGANWTNQISGSVRHLTGVAYGNGMFAVVGSAGEILTSTNGVSWSQTTGTLRDLKAVTYRDGLFVAVGDDVATRSTNGINWTAVTTLAGKNSSIAHDGTWFVMTADLGTVLLSTNGSSWSEVGVAPNIMFSSIAYGNGKFIAGTTNGDIYASTNGTNWARADGGGFTSLLDMVNVNGQLIAVGERGTILASSNAVTWETRNSGTTNTLSGVAAQGGQYVAVGSGGTIVTSLDAVNWVPQSSITNVSLLGIAAGNGLFAMAGANGVYTSTDASSGSWIRRATNSFPLEGIAFADGHFVAVGQSLSMVTSADGTNWAKQTLPGPSINLYTASFGKGLWVTAGFPGSSFRISNDLTNWASVPSGVGFSISGITYANGQFVACADYGIILVSTNGTNWVVRQTKSMRNLWAGAYVNSSWVVAGVNGTILQSDSTAIPWLAGAFDSDQGGFRLTISGELGRSYRLQGSTNFSVENWQDLLVWTNTTGTTQFLDVTQLPRRFYRAVSP